MRGEPTWLEPLPDDLLDGADTERTRLSMVRSKPLPFPPEPLRYAGIQATRWSLAQADRRAGLGKTIEIAGREILFRPRLEAADCE